MSGVSTAQRRSQPRSSLAVASPGQRPLPPSEAVQPPPTRRSRSSPRRSRSHAQPTHGQQGRSPCRPARRARLTTSGPSEGYLGPTGRSGHCGRPVARRLRTPNGNTGGRTLTPAPTDGSRRIQQRRVDSVGALPRDRRGQRDLGQHRGSRPAVCAVVRPPNAAPSITTLGERFLAWRFVRRVRMRLQQSGDVVPRRRANIFGGAQRRGGMPGGVTVPAGLRRS